MNRNQRNNILGIGLLAFCVVGVLWGTIKQINLKKNHLITSGRVYDYTVGGRGNAGGVWIDFVIEVNGKEYESSSRYLTADITNEGLDQLIGRSFPAVYNPSSPTNSHLMLLPEEFKKWGYSFPDTLKWLLPYIEQN